MKRIIFIVIISFSCFPSCDKICSTDDNKVGPCVHEYREAIFHIASVQDSVTSTAIKFAVIKNLKINGITQTNFFGAINYGIVYSDSIFYCNFPCGFSIEPGTYEFTISADGYKAKHVKFENVDYSIYEGGCPSYNDGGKRVTILLNKE